ncbi:hypothetical protein CASFOL_022776 [Castilleja foliolosa]|uniref:Uncharacterized protein n=1 Tax=Castilleja foliolosa TaxID=1961234 RepID=A0ABD3CVU3_9LAMI
MAFNWLEHIDLTFDEETPVPVVASFLPSRIPSELLEGDSSPSGKKESLLEGPCVAKPEPISAYCTGSSVDGFTEAPIANQSGVVTAMVASSSIPRSFCRACDRPHREPSLKRPRTTSPILVTPGISSCLLFIGKLEDLFKNVVSSEDFDSFGTLAPDDRRERFNILG